MKEKITTEELRKLAEDVYNGTHDNFSITHNKQEDKGEKFSFYTFKYGNTTLTTGDGGFEEYKKIFKQLANGK
jgi:hypothetical protein